MCAYDVAHDIEYNVAYEIFSSDLLCHCVLSGGLFHLRKDLAYSVVNEGLQLYHDVPDNNLLNDVHRCFPLRHVPSVVISEHARVATDQGHGHLPVCAHFQSGHPQHCHSRNLQDFKAVGGLLGDSCRLFSLLRCG